MAAAHTSIKLHDYCIAAGAPAASGPLRPPPAVARCRRCRCCRRRGSAALLPLLRGQSAVQSYRRPSPPPPVLPSPSFPSPLPLTRSPLRSRRLHLQLQQLQQCCRAPTGHQHEDLQEGVAQLHRLPVALEHATAASERTTNVESALHLAVSLRPLVPAR